jgi:hypothetical protein
MPDLAFLYFSDQQQWSKDPKQYMMLPFIYYTTDSGNDMVVTGQTAETS